MNISISDEILKAINYAINQQELKYDRTFTSAIKKVNSNKTYVISDDSGQERTVKCCIPGLELKVGMKVWVTIPMGKLRKMFVSGVV